MELSVIIVSWNSSADLRACLDSLQAGLAGITHEVIVVDNASSDGSPAMVRSAFPSVRLIENKTNSGFAAANNLGLASGRGEYFLLLNPDTLVQPGEIKKLLDFLRATPLAGVAGPAFSSAPGRPFLIRPWIYKFPGFRDELFADTFLEDLAAWLSRSAGNAEGGSALPPPGPVETDWISGACMLVRREALQSAGALDERFFLYMEELEWCRRIKNAGWQVFIVPSAGVFHTGGTSSSKRDPAELFGIYYESRYKFFSKHWPVAVVLLVRACKTVLLAVTILLRTADLGKTDKLKAALRVVLFPRGGKVEQKRNDRS
jgi:GT2 family glycosyltransferase